MTPDEGWPFPLDPADPDSPSFSPGGGSWTIPRRSLRHRIWKRIKLTVTVLLHGEQEYW